MGVNLVSLANNHIYDYGIEAFNDTFKIPKKNMIYPLLEQAIIFLKLKKSFSYIVGGYKISFISSTRAEKNIITPGATSDSPGVFRCYDNTLLKRNNYRRKTKK